MDRPVDRFIHCAHRRRGRLFRHIQQPESKRVGPRYLSLFDRNEFRRAAAER